MNKTIIHNFRWGLPYQARTGTNNLWNCLSYWVFAPKLADCNYHNFKAGWKKIQIWLLELSIRQSYLNFSGANRSSIFHTWKWSKLKLLIFGGPKKILQNLGTFVVAIFFIRLPLGYPCSWTTWCGVQLLWLEHPVEEL
jgi:hypothetical protein